MTFWYRIATLDLRSCSMNCQDAERLAGVSVLSLGGKSILPLFRHECNEIGNEGAERLAGVLPQCPALSALYVS